MQIDIRILDKSGQKLEFLLSEVDLARLVADKMIAAISLKVVANIQRDLTTINLKAALTGRYHTSCSLCLEKLAAKISQKLNLKLLPALDDAFKLQKEVTIDLADDYEQELDSYSGNKLDLVKYIEDQLILELPKFSQCRPDCRGICSRCGVSLNSETCQCSN